MIEGAETSSEQNIGAWRGGLSLARASWSVLKMDKSILAVPIISFAICTILMLVFSVLFFVLYHAGNFELSNIDTWSFKKIDLTFYLITFIFYLLNYFCVNYFSAVVISSAFQHFKSENSTLKSSLRQVSRNIRSIFDFSLFSATVGIILRFIDDRVPFIGNVIIIFADLAWSLASVFAIPVIISRQNYTNPLRAVKESAGVFTKVWSKDCVGSAGMGIVFITAFACIISLGTVTSYLLMMITPLFIFVTAPLTIIIVILLIALSSAMSSIFRAALYHYAITGESPVDFDKRMLKDAFIPKQKWFA